MSQALFYPWIDIKDEAWLKTSLLYWDSVRTIVPDSMDVPYSTETGRQLEQAQFLVPLRVRSGTDEIEELTEDVLDYLETAEATELLTKSGDAPIRADHIQALSLELRSIYREKLPYVIQDLLRYRLDPSQQEHDRFHVREGFADFYMTLLAGRLSERIGACLFTPLPAADRLAMTARLGAHPQASWRLQREYEAFGRRRMMPRHLTTGVLATLAIERVAIAADTPIDVLMRFRETHRDELALFRTKIESLASSVAADLPVEALRQRVTDLHAREVEPALSNLKAALKGRHIKSLSEGFLRVAFLSAGSTTVFAAAGLSVPIALLAGAGISLIASATTYNVDRGESLRTNAFSYLLAMERRLG